MGPCTVNRI